MGEGGKQFQDNANNGFNPMMAPKVKGPSIFEQAGALQSTAATGAADAEIAALMESIAYIQQMMQGNNQFTEAGLGGLTGVQQGSTAQGMNERLAAIMGGDQFGALADERGRAQQGQLAAGGLTRSGTAMDAMAAIPTDLAFQLENQLFGRQAGLADMGFQSQSRDMGFGAQIAALLGGQGQAEARGIRDSGEAEAGGILGEKGYQFQKDQQKDQNKSDLLGTVIGLGAMAAFSDPRLKKNVRTQGKIGPLDLVTWDWIDEAKKTIVGNYRTIGFMSNQVKEFFPDLVSEYGGYDVVNYKGLMERLDG